MAWLVRLRWLVQVRSDPSNGILTGERVDAGAAVVCWGIREVRRCGAWHSTISSVVVARDLTYQMQVGFWSEVPGAGRRRIAFQSERGDKRHISHAT